MAIVDEEYNCTCTYHSHCLPLVWTPTGRRNAFLVSVCTLWVKQVGRLEMKVVSLFTGAGGLDLGLQQVHPCCFVPFLVNELLIICLCAVDLLHRTCGMP